MPGEATDGEMVSGDGPSHLDGTWVLESLATPAGEQHAAEPSVTSAMTFADGAVFGHGGVNRFRGTYQTDGEASLTFGGVAATRMAGPAAAMSAESRFFAALSATAALRIVDDRLELFGAGGEAVATLVRAVQDADNDQP